MQINLTINVANDGAVSVERDVEATVVNPNGLAPYSSSDDDVATDETTAVSMESATRVECLISIANKISRVREFAGTKFAVEFSDNPVAFVAAFGDLVIIEDEISSYAIAVRGMTKVNAPSRRYSFSKGVYDNAVYDSVSKLLYHPQADIEGAPAVVMYNSARKYADWIAQELTQIKL